MLPFMAVSSSAQSSLKGDVNEDGTVDISDVVVLVNIILNRYLTCPDDHHPHLIDLGLPSGTKWACCNVGADKPEAYGGYYAWGETREKSEYTWESYAYYNKGTGDFTNIGSDISDTQYDVACVQWGGGWHMPTLSQIEELLNNTTSEWTNQNGVAGRKFTGSNGGTIFLPAAGYRWNSELYNAGNYGIYWSSTLSESYENYAYYLDFYSDITNWSSYYRFSGQSVRPVR